MLPIVQELAPQEQSGERERTGLREVEQAVLVQECERYRENACLDRAQQVLSEGHAERGNALAPVVGVAMGEPADAVFEQHQADRRRQDHAPERRIEQK